MPPTEEDLAWLRSTFHPIPRPALPDDCVEYSLYIISPNADISHDQDVRLQLREVHKAASALHKKWLKDYIWQRQGFGLELVKEDGEVRGPTRLNGEEWTDISHVGCSLLRGRTEYGDSIEDEWVVVWLLKELTTQFPDLWVKISDTDGEFLLIEASGTLPAWLEPDVAENRVWLHDGGLVILIPTNATRAIKQTSEHLSLSEARKIILEEPKRIMDSASIQDEAFYRLRNYPAQIKDNMHNALIRIPRKIAFLLRQKPSYIAPAIEAFYLRDTIALKPLQAKSSPEKLTFAVNDLVTIPVKFPRVGYAQLRSQNFSPPAAWVGSMPAETEGKIYAQVETGMKVACGFEMLISDSQNQDRAAVREIKLLLEDIETGDEILPTDAEIAQYDLTEDDEKWLDISFDDLEGELAGGTGRALGSKKKPGKFGDEAAQENLRRMVKQFEDFLSDDKAGLDGAGLFDELSDDDPDNEDDDVDSELDDDTGEDKEMSFDEDEFTRMMREMMGMPPEVMDELMKGKTTLSDVTESSKIPHREGGATSGKVQELDEANSEDDRNMEEVMREMEAELMENGALNLEAGSLIQNVNATHRAVDGKGKNSSRDQGSTLSDGDYDTDPHVDLVRNLLESFKSQSGMPGPGGNLMGMMGLSMPRDEEESEEDTQVNHR